MQNGEVILKTGAYAGFIGGAVFVLYAVFTSTSSTAAIGLIMIPFYGFPAAGVGWALVYTIFALLDLSSGRSSWKSKNVLVAAMFLSAFLIAGFSFFVQRSALSVAENPSSTPQALEEISQRWIPWVRRDVDRALAQHPSTPAVILETMAESSDNDLVQLAGANTSTPPAVLEKIATGPLIYERVLGLASNRNISRAIMEKLIVATMSEANTADRWTHGLYKTFVLAALARNSALPQDLFDRLVVIDSPTHFLVHAIINQPRVNCMQMSGLLASAPSLENASLYNEILNKMKEKGCSIEE